MLDAMMLRIQFPVSEFLLRDDHPEVCRAFQERTKPPAKPQPTAKSHPAAGSAEGHPVENKGAIGYEVRHFQMCRDIGMTFPPVYTDYPGAAEALEHLPTRYKEAALIHIHCVQKVPGNAEIVVDLHPNIDFGSLTYTTQCHCIVASSRLFAVRRMRELCGFPLVVKTQADTLVSRSRCSRLRFIPSVFQDSVPSY